MIPEFPNFKKLELSDKQEIETFTSSWTPYSDFNFTSLWCWDTWGKTRLSKLNGNLIFKLGDYLTDSMFCSFIGDNNLNDTADKLLVFSKKEKISQKLKFIPEEIAKKLDRKLFNLEEDTDHFDYILDNERLIEYKGRSLHNHACFKRKFLKMYSNYLNLKILNFEEDTHQCHIKLLNELWVKNKIVQNKEIVPELEDSAIKKIFGLAKNNNLFSLVAIFHSEKLIAFTIDELLGGDYSIRHFMKADTSHKGVYSYL